MIGCPVRRGSNRCVDRQPTQRVDDCVPVSRACLANRLNDGPIGDIAQDRVPSWIVVIFFLIRCTKSVMFRSVDGLPRIPRGEPSLGRFILQRVQIFGLSGERANDCLVLKETTRVALSYEANEDGPESGIENRFWVRGIQRIDRRTRINLAQCWPLLADPFDVTS